MDYINQFIAIDTNKDGIITRRELFKYALMIGQDASMVETWFKLFDADDKGSITIEDMSRTLGVPPPKYYKQKLNKRGSTDGPDLDSLFRSTPNLPQTASQEDSTDYKHKPFASTLTPWKSQDTTIRSAKPISKVFLYHELDAKETATDDELFHRELACHVSSLLDEAIESHLPDSEVAQKVGQRLEKLHGKHWHVFVSQQKIGCSFGHIPGKFAHLRHKGYSIIAFKTLNTGF